MLNFPKQFFLLLAFIITSIFISEVTKAQSLRVTPLIIETQAKRGRARELIELTNTGNTTFRARIYTSPFTYNRKGIETLQSSPHDLTPYLTFSPRELVIEPNQTRTIRLSAKFLPSVPDREYRVLLYADQLDEINQSHPVKSVSIKTRLGITVYVRKGNLMPNLQVQQAIYNPVKKQIQLLVNNQGSATTRPKTQWKLTQSKQEIAAGKIEETTIISGGDRDITIPYSISEKILKLGNYQLSGQLDWSFPQTGTLNFNIPLNISEQDIKKLNPSKFSK